METNSNKQKNGEGGQIHKGESWSDRDHKEVPTVASVAKYDGDYKAVAGQANVKIPNNPEDVIARNTTSTITCSGGCSCQQNVR